MNQFFKNVVAFRLLGESARVSVDSLQAVLAEKPHRLPGPQDLSARGFVAPLGGDLVEQPKAGMMVIALKESYRDLPASVVNEAVDKKVAEILAEEGRPVGRPERQRIKDDVLFSLLPHCFIKHRTIYAMLTEQLLMVDTSSVKRAEELASAVREALGSLKAIPLTTQSAPTQVMTHWVREGVDAEHFSLGESCLLAGSRSTAKVTVQNLDLQTQEVSAYLESGLHVQKLALDFEEEVAFELGPDLQLKKIRLSDVVEERLHDHVGESGSVRDVGLASWLLVGAAVSRLINELVAAMGGEPTAETAEQVA